VSVYVTSHVWHHSCLRGTALLLLLALADQANDEGIAWPSVATLANKTRLSDRTVQNLMPSVLATGELEIVRESNGGHNPRVYRVVAPAPPERAPKSRGEKTSPRPSAQSGVKPAQARGEVFDAGVKFSQPGVKVATSRGEARFTQTVLNRKEPSLEPCTEPSRERARVAPNGFTDERVTLKDADDVPRNGHVRPKPSRDSPGVCWKCAADAEHADELIQGHRGPCEFTRPTATTPIREGASP
jgi:hypothetical protein